MCRQHGRFSAEAFSSNLRETLETRFFLENLVLDLVHQLLRARNASPVVQEHYKQSNKASYEHEVLTKLVYYMIEDERMAKLVQVINYLESYLEKQELSENIWPTRNCRCHRILNAKQRSSSILRLTCHCIPSLPGGSCDTIPASFAAVPWTRHIYHSLEMRKTE